MDISLCVQILVFARHDNVCVSGPCSTTAAHSLRVMYIPIDFLLKKETRHTNFLSLLVAQNGTPLKGNLKKFSADKQGVRKERGCYLIKYITKW